MSRPLTNQKFRRPLIALGDLLAKESAGSYVEQGDYVPFMFRAIVYAIDTLGGRLENPTGDTSSAFQQTLTDSNGTRVYSVYPKVGPKNPPDSIRARIIANNIDQFVDDDNLRTYWPLFPGLQSPSPGELIYIVFEDRNMAHGLWVSKVPFSNDFDNPSNIQFSDVSLAVEKNNGDNSLSVFPGDPVPYASGTTVVLSMPGDVDLTST